MKPLFFKVLFLILLFFIGRTLFTYSREGDVKTYAFGGAGLQRLRQQLRTRTDVVQHLQDLIINKESSVKWNRFMVIAMFGALTLMFFFREEPTLHEYLLVSGFLFLLIDLPNRWAYAHISRGIIEEAIQTRTLFSTLPDDVEKPPSKTSKK